MREDIRDKVAALNQVLTTSLAEDYSVGSYDQLEILSRSIQRAFTEINDALVMAESVEPTSVQIDARDQVKSAISRLREARKNVEQAMRVVMPHMDIHAFRDSTV